MWRRQSTEVWWCEHYSCGRHSTRGSAQCKSCRSLRLEVLLSADNMNFTSEITVLQKYVNTSDYTNPKHFTYNSHTYFPFPRGVGHLTDYVTICQAPDYLSSNFSKPEAESLHILSWGSPYPWQVVFPVITVLSCILVFNALIISVALCIAWPYLKSKHRQKIVYCKCCILYCLNFCSHNRFIRLN